MPAPPEPDSLSGASLFLGLSREELTRLAPSVHKRAFAAGASVVVAGQPGEAVYVVLEGSVKASVVRPDGTEVILAVLGPGEVVGEMSPADSLGRSADVATMEETTLLWMDRAAFRAGIEEVPKFARNLAEVLSRRLRLTNAHLISLASLDVPGRVASQLLALAREYGEKTPDGATRIPIRLTQTDLAALVGASRVRVNQALGYYKKCDLVSVGKDGRITVHDQAALGRRAR